MASICDLIWGKFVSSLRIGWLFGSEQVTWRGHMTTKLMSPLISAPTSTQLTHVCFIVFQENACENFVGKMLAMLFNFQCVNSLCSFDAIWQHRSVWILDQVMVCCLMAPSHYLDQCWLTNKSVLWYSPDSNFPWSAMKLTHWGQDKMAAISQTPHSNAFSWMKMVEFLLKFRWSLFLRVQLSIFPHWFR